jgi:DNA-binding CsgD family transcriptional regulator
VSQAAVAPFVHTTRRSDLIEMSDVQALFRLEGELSELPQGSERQRFHALEGMVALVGAQVGIWGAFSGLEREGGHIHDAVHTGWDGERERELYVDYLARGQVRSPDPTIALIQRRVTPPVCTFTREQLIRANDWHRAPHFHQYRRAAGIDAFMYSVRLERDAGYVIAIHRPVGARPFTERERRLVDLFHRESRALAPRPRAVLAPHLDKTLRALLRGLTEKQVASELGLSPHTVHEYVASLYRRFGVTSRAELFVKVMGKR